MSLDIPDYEIDCELGSGGMASVYKARHLRLHRLVALKVMHPELTLRDHDFSERFLREARIAADLSHPNIVQVYDVNLHGKNHFIAMEFVSGGDLKERLETPIDRDELIDIIAQITSGLDYAHSRGYIHRDIKPANILFRDTGEALVSDFGIARAIDSNTHLTKTGSVIGTPTYMSPEQASGVTIDGRSDLYSVAVIVFEILTGTVPYVGETSLSIAIKHISEPIPTLPKALQAVQPFINRGLAKDPQERFSNGVELLEMLQDALDHLSTEDIQATKTLLLVRPHEKKKRAGQTTAFRKNTSTTIGNNRLQYPIDQLKPQWPKIAAGVVIILLLISAGIWFSGDDINKNQQIQLQQLLAAAQTDINSGRLFQPPANNALEKYQTALAISADYPETLSAVSALNNLLLQQAELALSDNDINQAEQIANQVLRLSPDNELALLQLENINEWRQQQLDKRQSLVLSAQQAVNTEQWPAAIELFRQFKNQYGTLDELAPALSSMTEQLISQSRANTDNKQYQQATQLLQLASDSADIAEDRELRSAVKSAQNYNSRQQTLVKQRSKIDTLLTQAKANPSAEQAAKLYQQVLSLDAQNATAKAGVARNIDSMLSQAERAINQTDLSTANKTLNRLESSMPLSGQQLNKKNELRSLMRSTAAQQADLVNLFDRFERYMQAPKVTSADKIFRRIEAINYNHPRLPALRQELADGYMVLAQREAQAEDWNDVITWCNRGLEHVPDHPQLRSMLATATENDKGKTSAKKLLDFFR
jgi:serine/threonine protein kinase